MQCLTLPDAGRRFCMQNEDVNESGKDGYVIHWLGNRGQMVYIWKGMSIGSRDNTRREERRIDSQ